MLLFYSSMNSGFCSVLETELDDLEGPFHRFRFVTRGCGFLLWAGGEVGIDDPKGPLHSLRSMILCMCTMQAVLAAIHSAKM